MKYIVFTMCMLLMACTSNKVANMATINQLSAVDTLAAGDQIPVYDSSNGDARKASMTVMQAFMQDNLTFGEDFIPIFTIVGTTDIIGVITANLTAVDYNVHVIITDASFPLGFIVAFPTTPIDKQEMLFNTTNAIASITAADPQPTTVGYPSSLAAGGFFRMKYDLNSDTWNRVG